MFPSFAYLISFVFFEAEDWWVADSYMRSAYYRTHNPITPSHIDGLWPNLTAVKHHTYRPQFPILRLTAISVGYVYVT